MLVRLGSFELDRPIGKGGMGQVWLAHHESTGVPIAVKVDLHPPDATSAEAFLHEVEAIAALDHQNVVVVLEHGVVDRQAQRDSEGDLREGSRWLAMELALGGSVGETPPQSWQELMHVARGTLRALAHSHARGVVHRDIKPANLLLAGSEVGVATRPESLLASRVVLSDFGIAEHRGQASSRTEESVGTPHYMAPEQIEAHWRDQGPWTDLYAVGVLLWRMTTGRYPFEGRNPFQIYRGHLLAEPPAFEPRMGVPDGFEAVLRKALAKSPADRYRFAAHMERALEDLGGAQGRMVAMPVEDEETVQTASGTAGSTQHRNRRSAAGTRQRNFQLQGAGLSLFGLRTPPLVGRDDICETLWNRLVEVRAARRARVVLLRGAVGSGKTRLATWLGSRAHELGVCETLTAHHRQGAQPFAALREMLVRALATRDLGPEELDERLEKLFPDADFDRRSLAALLAPEQPDRAVLTAREARVLVLSVLTYLARDNSLVVHLDDAHLDLEALELADHLLALQGIRPSSLLLVLTIRDDDLTENPEADELIGELSEDDAVHTEPVGPLDAEAQARLVRTLVGLEGAVAQRLEERTAGNPLFAVQLIRSWIEQGVLQPGPEGFRVSSGYEALLPADLEDLWASRLQAFLGRRSDDDALALEAAAAIGMQVRYASWLATFPLLEIEPASHLFREIARRHWVSIGDDGTTWRFVHAGLREVLEHRARAQDRWEDVNLAAAIQLQQSGERAPHRLARHLLAACVWEQAAEPLAAAIADDIDRGDVRDDTLVNQLQTALEEQHLAPEDPWWGRLRLIRAGRARFRRELDDASRLALGALREAEQHAWPQVRAMALREASRVMRASSNLEQALDYAQRAEAEFQALGDGMRAADVAHTIGMIHFHRGEMDVAREKLTACVEAIVAGGWRRLLHEPLLGLALLEQRSGNLKEARHWLARCRRHAEELGLSAVLANCRNIEGEIARYTGDLELAATCYRESSDRYLALDSRSFVFPTLNLGLLDVLAERYDAAVERMRLLLAWLKRNPQPLLVTYTQVILLAAEAGLGNMSAASESLFAVSNYLASSSVADGDIALMAEKGGVLLLAAGHDRQGRRALNIAINQYRALDRHADAERLERRI